MAELPIGEVTWERMIRAVEKVKERLARATSALERAGVPYAVVGGHAVATWVARVDEAAVRNTPNVDLAIRRADLTAATAALAAEGFIFRHVNGVDMFLDGSDAKARDAVHVIFANEKIRPEHELPVPDLSESETTPAFHLLNLEALVRMSLTSFRRTDMVYLRDLIDVGLVDESWPDRLPGPLADRLRALLDDPDG